jgi:hypothetical protein
MLVGVAEPSFKVKVITIKHLLIEEEDVTAI